MKNKLSKTIFSVLTLLALPIIVSASNETPTVKSEIVKDGTLDFNVTLSDLEIDSKTNYKWAIVRTQATEGTTWNDATKWDDNTMEIYLDFSKSDIKDTLDYVNTAYLIIKDTNNDNIIIDHVPVDVRVPYAYGYIPYIDPAYNWWSVPNCSTTFNSCNIQTVEIQDENIIKGYLKLKDSNGNVNSNDLARYIESLGLKEKDIPISWLTTSTKSEKLGITNKSLYFVWSKYVRKSTDGTKDIYGVTIYDNGYSATTKPNTTDKTEDKVVTNEKPTSTTPSTTDKVVTNEKPTSTTPSTTDKVVTNTKPTSNTTENPKTGVKSYTVISIFVVTLSITLYIILRKNNKFNKV